MSSQVRDYARGYRSLPDERRELSKVWLSINDGSCQVSRTIHRVRADAFGFHVIHMSHGSFNKLGQILQRRSQARVVIFLADPFGDVLADDENFRSNSRWRKAPGHSHLTSECRIVGFEDDELDDPLVRDQFDKPAQDHIGIVRELASVQVMIVTICQCHPVSATGTRVELIDAPGHPLRR
jgi:hypothetical protein